MRDPLLVPFDWFYSCILGFKVQGSGFRVQGLGFRVEGSSFRL